MFRTDCVSISKPTQEYLTNISNFIDHAEKIELFISSTNTTPHLQFACQHVCVFLFNLNAKKEGLFVEISPLKPDQ